MRSVRRQHRRGSTDRRGTPRGRCKPSGCTLTPREPSHQPRRFFLPAPGWPARRRCLIDERSPGCGGHVNGQPRHGSLERSCQRPTRRRSHGNHVTPPERPSGHASGHDAVSPGPAGHMPTRPSLISDCTSQSRQRTSPVCIRQRSRAPAGSMLLTHSSSPIALSTRNDSHSGNP